MGLLLSPRPGETSAILPCGWADLLVQDIAEFFWDDANVPCQNVPGQYSLATPLALEPARNRAEQAGLK